MLRVVVLSVVRFYFLVLVSTGREWWQLMLCCTPSQIIPNLDPWFEPMEPDGPQTRVALSWIPNLLCSNLKKRKGQKIVKSTDRVISMF